MNYEENFLLYRILLQNAFKLPTPAPAVANVAVESPKLATNSNVKEQMIQTLAQQTGMNLEWSRK